MGNFLGGYSQSSSKVSLKRAKQNETEEDTPVRKRIRSTYDYIYRELFCKGEGSDLTVKSLNRSWQLHRLYVKQSPFFCAMLDGGWKESDSNLIELEISDPNINESSLDTIFGSFYRDTVMISENTVLGVLAAATWFHMDDIRALCSEFMERRFSFMNLIEFFKISKQYNLPSLKRSSVQWLADRLLILEDNFKSYEFLRQIPIDLMREVIKKPDLVVIQLEQDVFLLLLKWVYLQRHSDYEVSSSSQLLRDAYTYFTSSGCSFLETEEGAEYAPVFRAVRWDHVLNVYKTTQRILRDHVVPEAWLSSVFCHQWLRLLHMHDIQTRPNRLISGDMDSPTHSRVRTTLASRESTSLLFPWESASDQEVGLCDDLPEDVFWATSERCGRKLLIADSTCSWRWTGYHFGLDVVIKYKRRTFSVIRFTDSSSAEGAVSHVPRLRLLLALRVLSVADDAVPSEEFQDTLTDAVTQSSLNVPLKESSEVSTSGVLSLSLEENVVHDVLRLPDDFPFPVLVSANLLRYNPIGCSVPNVCIDNSL